MERREGEGAGLGSSNLYFLLLLRASLEKLHSFLCIVLAAGYGAQGGSLEKSRCCLLDHTSGNGEN